MLTHFPSQAEAQAAADGQEVQERAGRNVRWSRGRGRAGKGQVV